LAAEKAQRKERKTVVKAREGRESDYIILPFNPLPLPYPLPLFPNKSTLSS